jgi:crossover junction endodeoxyribonuclease RuvC
MTRPIRILGIDPGLRRTGWGMVEIAGNRLGFLGCGSVTTSDRDALAARLLAIHDGLMRILEEFRPDEAAVEATFVNKDAKATLKLGQARGIAMVVPARAGVPVAEYAPNLVKKSIVGAGHGDKAQVRMMIGVLLPKADPSSDDAADALAIAVTHAHHQSMMRSDEARRGNAPLPLPACGERSTAEAKRRRWVRGLTGSSRRGSAPSPARRGAARHPLPASGERVMIGKLKGVIDSYGEDSVIVDVNGVGYLVHCSARTLQELPRAGEPATLVDRDPCA